MFARKKPAPEKKRDRGDRDLSQFGLFDIPDDFDPSGGIGDDGGDSDLEAELAAITAGNRPKPKPRKKPAVDPSDLDRMVAASMKDIGSDEELSGDDDDPDLLGELSELTGEAIEPDAPPAEVEEGEVEPEQVFLPTTTVNVIEILNTRIQMYEIAEQSAKEQGEAGRARRFNRGVKTLKDMLKQANSGKSINIDDIPPEVSVKNTQAAGDDGTIKSDDQISTPVRQAPSIPSPVTTNTPPSPEKSPTLEEKPENPKITALNARKHEYKVAALNAKRAGDTQSAIQFVKVLKQFDVVIKAAEDGQEVDLSDMPPPPEQLKEFLEKLESAAQNAPEPEPTVQETSQPEEPEPQPEPLSEPKNLLEALQQRLDKYKSVEAAAKAEGNSGKARRFGRIVKQYEDAIKMHKAGKPIPLDELPTPPGFGPLPVEGTAAPSSAPAPAEPKPSSESAVSPVSPKPDTPPKPPLRKQESSSRTSGNHVPTTLMEKQMALLLERQKEFKVAAIEAKKAGEIEQAKEYLKIYKGFEGLLNAASGGFPVDLSTLPIPPSQRANLEDSFAFVNDNDCDPLDDISDISVRMEEHLAKQLMMCKNTRDHHKAMGDVAGMNRFENLALSVQKELDLVRFSRRKKLPIPKFHYEQKSFNIVHCNTDLTDNEIEIVVVRGINYNVPNPKDVDTYVKVEFPYPQDYPFKTRTNLIKNTESPDYDQSYKVEFQRSSRQCQRMFKRHAAKFEIYSRGCCLGGICRNFSMCCFSGFLRSDVLIGTVSVKLQPLETKCDIHDSFDLMDGRKTVGGKLEIKIRVRNPILTKQIEHFNEKWLVLDV